MGIDDRKVVSTIPPMLFVDYSDTSPSQDPLLKTMANGGPFIVVSVGYRLAPEDPFPKGPEDCYDAAEWLVDHAEEEFGVPLKSISGEVPGIFEVSNRPRD